MRPSLVTEAGSYLRRSRPRYHNNFADHEEAPRSPAAPLARVSARRQKAERLAFSVKARHAEQAIERTIEENDIPKSERWRISVQRET